VAAISIAPAIRKKFPFVFISYLPFIA